MAAIPEKQETTVRKIYELHEAKRKGERERWYLGASEIGKSCARRVWLRFRWAGQRDIDGRILRLFETGHMEEVRFLAELKALGMQVEGTQHEITFADGHGAGHIDAAVLGLIEAPKTWHVVDVKTAKLDVFKRIIKEGVAAVYPEYVVQATLYAGKMGLDRIAIAFVCKDNDEIHIERFNFDKDAYAKILARAEMIVNAVNPPARISNDASWYECKICPFHAQCHEQKLPEVNCRTCAHSSPVAGGKWSCGHWGAPIPLEGQYIGCDEHRFLPDLLERVAKLVEVDGNKLKWQNLLTDRFFSQPHYTSKDLATVNDFRAIGAEWADDYKEVFKSETDAYSNLRMLPGPELGDAPASDLEPIYGKEIAQ